MSVEQSRSFLSLRLAACKKLKKYVIERRKSDAFLFLIYIMSVKRLLTEHYNVINQHQIIFLDKNAMIIDVKYFST